MLAAAFIGRGRVAKGLAERIKQEVRSQIESSIADPVLQDHLIPTYEPGCKRLLISNDWYPTLAREDVEVCVSAVERITPSGILTADGVEHPADTIILGTGFAASDFPGPVRVVGQQGLDLAERWREGAATHLGISVDGFPNLYFLAGPNTGLGHNSMVFMIESQIHFVMEHLRELERAGATAIEVKPEVEAAFNAGVDQRTEGTIWKSGCTSWYLDEKGQNGFLWPGSTVSFRKLTRRVELSAVVMRELQNAAPHPNPLPALAGRG
jgi:cation diffusion facilitator CzcD-associated flavoprotein CzcO